MGNDEGATTPKYLAQFGQLPAFHPAMEKIAEWNCFSQQTTYRLINGLRYSIFLNSVGGKTYSLLQDLLTPVKPS